MVSHAASTRGKPQGAVASWLRNLFRPGLRPNGTSNNARHRERDRSDSALHLSIAQLCSTIHLIGEGK
jgi:hypothetical protein